MKHQKIINVISWSIFLALIIHILSLFWQGLITTYSYFGTYHSPFSDALGPWLHGALEILFKGETPYYLVRPLVSFYIGSVYNLFGSIEAYAWWNCLLMIGLSVSLQVMNLQQKFIQLLFLGLLVSASGFILNTYPTRLMPDFPSLIFTFFGSIFIAEAFKNNKPATYVSYAGFLMLGLAAGIRGTQLPLIIIFFFYWVFYFIRKKPLVVLVSFVLFCLPTLIDVLLRKFLELRDTGFINLYCFYTDPEHNCGYNQEVNELYALNSPSNSEVFKTYMSYVFFDEGLKHILQNTFGVLAKNICLVPKFWLISLGVFGIGLWQQKIKGNYIKYLFWSLHLIIVPLIFKLLYDSGWYPWYLVLVYCLLVYGYVLYQKFHLSFIFLSIYIFGSLFLSANGIFGEGGRYNGSVQIFFFLGYFTVILQDIGPALNSNTQLNSTNFISKVHYLISIFICLMTLCIYSSSLYLFFDDLPYNKTGFQHITDDKEGNRTLIYHPQKGIGYIEYTTEKDLSKYSRIKCDSGFWNNSFETPCTLEK